MNQQTSSFRRSLTSGIISKQTAAESRVRCALNIG
jgi:hypothetical protein